MTRLTKWTIAALMVLSSLAMAREPRADEPGIGVARQIIEQVDGRHTPFDSDASQPMMFVAVPLLESNNHTNVMLLIDLLIEYDLRVQAQIDWQPTSTQVVRTIVVDGFTYNIGLGFDGFMIIAWGR